MMRERGRRIFGCRRAMHESDWTQGGLARIAKVSKPSAAIAEWYCVRRRELHEEIVRVLGIDNWTALVGFTGLKQERRAARRKGKRLKTEHTAQLERTGADLAKCHRHEPVCRFKLCNSSRSTLGIHTHHSVVV